MGFPRRTVLAAMAAVLAAVWPSQAAGPQYEADATLKFPADYREWVFLSSGSGMTYGPLGAGDAGSPKFDNVFVNPEAYRSFLKTGRWPDRTIFVLEVRRSQSQGSINKAGHFQTDLVGVEAEVKDTSAASGEWTFYGFDTAGGKSAKAIPRTASCYSCHAKNAAVENTFVQFYPVLYGVAAAKGTINSAFAAGARLK